MPSLFGVIPQFLFPLHPLILNDQVLDLQRQSLIVRKQCRLLILLNSYLLHEEVGSCSFVLLGLHMGKSLCGLYELPFVCDDHALKLFSLSKQLLGACGDLLLQVEVLLQKSVPLTLADTFTALMFL